MRRRPHRGRAVQGQNSPNLENSMQENSHPKSFGLHAVGAAPTHDRAVNEWTDEILEALDVGVVICSADSTALRFNNAAVRMMSESELLRIDESGRLAPKHGARAHLEAAILGCSIRGQHRLVRLGGQRGRVWIGIRPLTRLIDGRPALLIIVGRHRPYSELSLILASRELGLTPAESKVMAGLAEGRAPTAIASQHGCALSTVRTQVSAVQGKVGSRRTAEVIAELACLPAMCNSTIQAGAGTFHRPLAA